MVTPLGTSFSTDEQVCGIRWRHLHGKNGRVTWREKRFGDMDLPESRVSAKREKESQESIQSVVKKWQVNFQSPVVGPTTHATVSLLAFPSRFLL